MRRGAVGIAVLERVARSIDARSLPIPEAEHSLHLPIRLRLDLLRAEHGGGCKVLVHGGQEFDSMRLQPVRNTPELKIDAAERRAAIARDETRGVEPCSAIAPRLIERDTHDGLRAGQKHTAELAVVTVGELIGVE